jgi:hypothetical protein
MDLKHGKRKSRRKSQDGLWQIKTGIYARNDCVINFILLKIALAEQEIVYMKKKVKRYESFSPAFYSLSKLKDY